MPHDTLYSFRRCPYAMRARLALKISGQNPEIREITLKNKPEEMLTHSPKGTVPVLVCKNGAVIDESFEIMIWALNQNDPDHWLSPFQQDQHEKAAQLLIEQNDVLFKQALDRYKYPNRYPEEGSEDYLRAESRDKVEAIFIALNQQLAQHNAQNQDKPSGAMTGLMGSFSVVDAAILPFIRQAAHVDKGWFLSLSLPYLHDWLDSFLNSSLFLSIMPKLSPWQKGDSTLYLQKIQSHT